MIKVEVRAFGKLQLLFGKRGWQNPVTREFEEPLTAKELCQTLDIPIEDVEAVFINRDVKPLSTTLRDGDRVSYVPPGIPSIHRFNLGFYDAKE